VTLPFLLNNRFAQVRCGTAVMSTCWPFRANGAIFARPAIKSAWLNRESEANSKKVWI
jgi:hypothetical protein